MILARAPLRISLGGGGTDLPSYYKRSGGFILSACIDKYVYIYVNRPSADRLIRVKYSRYEQVKTVDEIQHDLVRPTLGLLDFHDNIEIVSMADVPDGTGLGSSGSYLVALLTALYELKREKVPTQDLAEQAFHIEMDLAGHAVGKHDQYLAAFGGITCLDIAKDGKVSVRPLAFTQFAAEEFRYGILLYFTGFTRNSETILSEQKTQSEKGDAAMLGSLDRTLELGYQIKETLEEGNFDKFGLLLDEHWQNKKLRSEKMANSDIERWYEIAKQNGALGGKIIGAGGGGFLMLYSPLAKKAAVRRALAAEGLQEMSFNFDYQGAKILANF